MKRVYCILKISFINFAGLIIGKYFYVMIIYSELISTEESVYTQALNL